MFLRRCLLLTVLCVMAFLSGMFLMVSCDDDDDDDDSSPLCPIIGNNMAQIPGAFNSNDCQYLGIDLVFDKLFADPTLSMFKVVGQYSIQNENEYYLRGTGLDRNHACFHRIEYAGKFTVLTEFLSCREDFRLDLVATPDPEATPFCSINVLSDVECESDDNWVNDDDDDIWSDDDDYTCAYAQEFTWLYDSCSVTLVDGNGNDMSLSEAIADCNSCVGDCSFAYIDDDDCNGAIACILDLCFDKGGKNESR